MDSHCIAVAHKEYFVDKGYFEVVLRGCCWSVGEYNSIALEHPRSDGYFKNISGQAEKGGSFLSRKDYRVVSGWFVGCHFGR